MQGFYDLIRQATAGMAVPPSAMPGPVPPRYSALIAEMEAQWRAINRMGGGAPDYIIVPAEVAVPRRVYHWRGKRFVCGERLVPAREFMAALGARA